ncbi:MAG: arylsulfatase [Verrucomicrobiales bacterium]
MIKTPHIFILSLFLCASHLTVIASEKPNVIVIMVDDLGYSDIGCYGGEIETPNLDALAKDGLRFSQFYNTAKCHSSRVSLLTGQYCIAAGDVKLTHAVTSAEVLKEVGYFTAMTGKWHLNEEPTDFGFDRYFGHLSGACNFFKGDGTFRLNGKPWKVPKSDFYTTVADVDFALDFLTEARQAKAPYYLYVAFNAPHAPLHALPDDYAKYKGRYDAGWDKIRDARIAKQKELGLLPANLKPSPRPPHVRAWDKMVPWQQDYEINRMVTLAAMIDRVDQEIGRLVADLRSHDELGNTMILFVSDNGACPYDRKKPLLNVEPTSGGIALADSTGWSWARNAPFRFYKQNQFEGGISSPGIVHWPAGLKTEAGSIVDTPVHLIDVLPTLEDLSGAKIPSKHPTRELRPVSGVSFRPILEGKELKRSEPIHFQFATDFGLRDGDWKAVSFKGQEWELYNIATDRTELVNVAESEPERLKAMVAKWKEMTLNVLHSERMANSEIQPAQDPKANREWTTYSDSVEPPVFQQKKAKPRAGIRARKNTKMIRKPGLLDLTFTGADPGIAMDLRSKKNLPAGSYVVSFELSTDWKGTGEIFYTIDEKTLPGGERVEFEVTGEKAQKIRIELKTQKVLKQLRIDVSDGKGAAVIGNLKLLGQDGKVLHDWTK